MPTRSAALQRDDAQAWTIPDLPLLDAARQRLGDPDAPRADAAPRGRLAADREQMDRVVDRPHRGGRLRDAA